MCRHFGLAFAAAVAAPLFACSFVAAQDLIIDTGPGNPTTSGALISFNDSGGFFQFVGMKITLTEPTDIGRIDAWMRGSGDFDVKLRANTGNQPGAELESELFSVLFNPNPTWISFAGIEWSVNPGTYWITFEPLVDAGSASFPPNVPNPLAAYSFLADGNPGWVDLGPSFKLGLRVYTVAGPEPILVPDDFATIQGAIDFAASGQIVEVAPGTYNEAINFFGKTITVRSAGGPGVTTINATGLNQPAVQIPPGSGAATTLQGFTITGGSHLTSWAIGGGLFARAGLTVEDCHFVNNIAESGGGAGVIDNATVYFNNCVFDNNDNLASFTFGGGAYVNTATAHFNGCTFSNNDVGSSGGAMNINIGGVITATNCSFENNTAGNAGGAAMVIGSGANATFTGCTFDDNSAQQAGAVMVNSATAGFTTCDFLGNTATFAGSTAGGGIQAQGSANLSINGTDFISNNAFFGGGVQYINVSGTKTITGSRFRNNSAGSNGGGISVIGSGPTISNTEFCGNGPNHTAGSYTDGGGNTFASICTPDNNNPNNPEIILEPASTPGTFEGATNSGTSSCEPNGVDVFYAFTITGGPKNILIDTCGSASDTALAVFDADDNEVGCATSCSGFPCTSVTACLPLPNLPDGDYLIRVSLQTGAAAGGPLDFILTFAEVEFETPGDLNNDMVVDEQDRALLCSTLGSSTGDGNFIEAADLDNNGTVNHIDQQMFNKLLPPCAGDIVTSATFQPPADGVIDGADLAFLLGAWGNQPSCGDMVTSRTFQPPPDGKVDGADLAYLLGSWGVCK